LRDPELAERLDLETLLERYVASSVAHTRAIRAARMSDRAQLERIRDGHRADPDRDPRRLELCERRIRCLDQCEAAIRSLDDDLAVIADLIRLAAQRTACPDAPPTDDTFDSCIAELDGRDAAAAELR
jgi:hypothetical protein